MAPAQRRSREYRSGSSFGTFCSSPSVRLLPFFVAAFGTAEQPGDQNPDASRPYGTRLH
jgi:hypothetical protein